MFDIESCDLDRSLWNAVESGQLDSVRALIESGAKVDFCHENKSLLMLSAEKNYPEVASFLLSFGADVNSYDENESTALFYAAQNCHTAVVEVLMKAGADLNHQDKYGRTAMTLAAENGHTGVVEMLMKAGADLNHQTKDGWTAVLYAAANDHTAVVEMLVKAGADVNHQTKNGKTAITCAAEKGHTTVVEMLMNAGADVNHQGGYGGTAITLAAAIGHSAVVEMLMKAGADVNRPNAYGWTATTKAAVNGHTAVVEMLVKAGVDMNRQDDYGRTAITLAADNGHTAVVEMLVKAGADVNHQGGDGRTAMTFAAASGHTAVVEMLVKAGADVNHQTKNGKTAITWAAEGGRTAVVEMLVKAGADLNHQDGDGRTAMTFAAASGHTAVVEMLVKAGADVNHQTKDGRTSITWAAEGGHTAVVEMLMKAGADVNHQDGDGRTATTIAAENGHTAVVEMLVKAGADLSLIKDGKTALGIAVKVGNLGLSQLLVSYGAFLEIIDGYPTISPLFSLNAHRKFKEAICTREFLILSTLERNQYDIWCLLLQVSDVDGVEDIIRDLVTEHPLLATVRDAKGRLAIDMATPAIKLVINSITLWHGKYRPAKGKPEHTSATCFVFKAMDESGEEPVPVALKLMRVKSQFQRETELREFGFDSDYVMTQIECYPARALVESDTDVVEVSSEEEVNGVLSKTQAERLYCVVMPLADRNMFVAMKQERFAGKKDLSEVVTVFTQLVKCVSHLHEKGVLHGDIKPMNMVRMGGKWILIDLDACCVIGKDCVGFKSSSAYVSPEAVYANASEGVVSVKSESLCKLHGVTPLLAHESFDVWSLGCILYQLCSEKVQPLFAADQDDNLNTDTDDAENSLWKLAEWSNKLKEKKLSKVVNLKARNLLSLMLSKDPLKRPTLSRVLGHPFLSEKSRGRMAGEDAEFDVFISYRVASDLKHAERLYEMLTNAGLKVWWDKKCLVPGKEWQKGFCHGLGSSTAFLCILSKAGTNQPFQALTSESYVDNVLLEHRLALELKHIDYIKSVFPIMIGEEVDSSAISDADRYSQYRSSYSESVECVVSVEKDLKAHLDELGLGTPLATNLSVHDVAKEIKANNGYFIGGGPTNTFEKAVEGIVNTLKSVPTDVETSKSSKSVTALRNLVSESQSLVVSLEEYEAVKAQYEMSIEALKAQHEESLKAQSVVTLQLESALQEIALLKERV